MTGVRVCVGGGGGGVRGCVRACVCVYGSHVPVSAGLNE